MMSRWLFKNIYNLHVYFLRADYTNIYGEGDFQHVQIDDITLEHGGRYHVEAFNEHGVVSSHFTIIVDNGLERYMPPFFTRELRQPDRDTNSFWCQTLA